MTRAAPLTFALCLGLAACGPGENDPGPGGVTTSEAQALDEAAAMLEAQKLPAEALDSPPPAAQDPTAQPEPQPTDSTQQ